MNGNPYVPADWTDVFFDGSISVKNSVIDSDFQGTVESIIIQNGYSGTITQSHDLTVTSGFRGGFTQECGSFNSNPSYAFYAGDFCVNGGIFRRLTGSGILSDPYMIYDVYGLQGLGREDDAGDANGLFAYWDNHNMGTSFYVKLANAIDASGTVNWNGGAGFIPLAFDSIQGTDSNFLDFNGNHQNISGLYIKQSGDNIGFFRKLGGYYGTEKIYDLSLAGGTIEATGQVSSLGNLGSLVGIVDGAVTITNCHSNATVRITALEPYDMGGLIGSLTGGGSQYSSVTGCSFTGRLEHSYYLNYAGGLIGGIWSGFNNISNCWVTLANKPLADQQVGGLIGNITLSHFN